MEDDEGVVTKFVQIKSGYSHALLLDDQSRVFSFGAGANGQLGIGPEYNVMRYPKQVL